MLSSSPPPPASPSPPHDRLPAWAIPALLLLVGVVLRAPSLALPLGPSDAALANAADDLAGERWTDLEGQGPLLPILLVVPVAGGLPAGLTLRLVALLLGALAPLLFHRLGLRLGLAPRAAALAALLLALHPVLVAHAGGPEAGAQALALLLLLVALGRLLDDGRGTRRGAVTWAGLATLALPSAGLYLLALLPEAVRRERTWRARLPLALAGCAALGIAWAARAGGAGEAAPVPVLALPALALVVLLPFVVPGWFRLLRAFRGPARVLRGWCVVALGQLALLAAGLLRPGSTWGWEAAAPTVLLAPFVVLGGVVGLDVLTRVWRLRVEAGALLAGLLGSLLLGLGPAQARLLGEHLAPAGRLYALGAAARLAEREAGPEGWLVLDLGPCRMGQARALGAWLGTRPVLVTPASGGPTTAPRGWPEGGPRTLALVTFQPEPGPVTTLGGFGIFNQEPAGRSGPLHVLRVRRP